MKAVIQTEYGPPEVVLKLVEVEKPLPKDDEVLVRVYACTVNRTDSAFRSGALFINRLFGGLFRPRFKTLGNEFAGMIDATGKDVKAFQAGDQVFGYCDSTFGAHAEYMIMKENGAIATLPRDVSYEEAAPLTEGGHYALGDLRAAKVTKGQKVLIYGATGAIGSAAVQLAKYFGAEVTAVCNTKNVDLVKSLGADVVIDYTKEDFTRIGETFDLVYDAVGKSSFRQCKSLLKEKGIYKSTELGKNGENIFLALVTPLFSGKKVIFPIPSINKSDLALLKELVETGVFKPVVDRQYTLAQIAEAYRYVESGQKTGSVVIKVM